MNYYKFQMLFALSVKIIPFLALLCNFPLPPPSKNPDLPVLTCSYSAFPILLMKDSNSNFYS